MKRQRMNKLVAIVCIVCMQITAVASQTKSAYGHDYFEISGNKIISNFMYEIEPKLAKFYDTLKLSEKEKKKELERLIRNLRGDRLYITTIKDLEATDPEATFVFTKLPQGKFPNLHMLAEHFSIKKEYKDKYGVELTKEEGESGLKLYKALFGKEYGEK